jgi:hypothetical protein
MKRNVGVADRTIRIIAGIVILSALVFVEGPLRWLGLVGLVPLLTGIFSYCPLYAPFGFTTCAPRASS